MIVGLGSSPSPKEARKLLRAMAKAAGCTCRPDVDHRPKRGADGLMHVTVRHDDWCALLQRRVSRFN